MKCYITALLFLLHFLMKYSVAECPMAGNIQACALLYEHGQCQGDYLSADDGDETPVMPDGWNDKISSYVVRRDCRLTIWKDGPNRGDRLVLGEGNYDGYVRRGWNDVVSSYACSCEKKKPIKNCVASDFWEVVISCDASESRSNLNCEFQEQVGIGRTVSESTERHVSDSTSSSTSMEIGIDAKFVSAKFRTEFGKSRTTGVNWSKMSQRTFNKLTTQSKRFTVEKGTAETLKQLVGRCGDILIYTPYFKLVNGVE